MKILSIVRFYHEKNKYFELNELREENIYFNKIDKKIFIDQGYYNDFYKKNFNYWISPEKLKSEKNDIFSIGIILFRLITLNSMKEINNFFENIQLKNQDLSTTKSLKNLIEKINLKTNNFQYLNNLKNEMMKKKVKR